MVTPGNRQSQHPAIPESLNVPSGMTRSQFRAMGTEVSFLLPEEQLEQGEEIIKSLFTYWEQTLSRFLEDSELSQLNRLAGKSVMVSELLFTVLSRALAAAEATDGLYDPTLLNQMVQLGYDRTFDAIPADIPALEKPTTIGGNWRDICLDAALRLVTLPAGIGIDFGGIAKGMAVDAALESLRLEGIEAALVNAGGDLAVLGVPPGEKQWPIAIEGKTDTWVIPLRYGAFATSGKGRRHWQQGAQARHHLIDPRTGLPAQNGLWSVTVVASRCEQAEVGAKVAFLLGLEEGTRFLNRYSLAGLFTLDDGTRKTAGDWPKEHVLK